MRRAAVTCHILIPHPSARAQAVFYVSYGGAEWDEGVVLASFEEPLTWRLLLGYDRVGTCA